MFGLGLPFLAVVGLLVFARIALGIYIWWSFRRLKKRVEELEDEP